MGTASGTSLLVRPGKKPDEETVVRSRRSTRESVILKGMRHIMGYEANNVVEALWVPISR